MATASDAPASTRRAPERLHRGVLGLTDITASTMANIAPAMSFYFRMGLIAVAALTTAIVMSVGYIIAVSAVVAIAGGWTSDMIAKYAHVHIAWQLLTAVLTLLAFLLVVRGVALSTKWAGAL